MSSSLDGLRQALSLSPDNVPLLLLYANACQEEFLLGDAQETYEKIIAQAPANTDAQLGLAKVLHVSGKTSEAIVRTEALVSQHPKLPAAQLFLARLYLADGQRPEAARAYEKMLELEGAAADRALEKDLYPQGRPEPGAEKPGKVALTEQGPVFGQSPDDDEDEFDDDEDDDDEYRDSYAEEELNVKMERPKINFAEVGGSEDIKEEIRMKILYPMQNAELFRAYGKKMGGGVLLYGPPGCGKTLISRATAGEIDANFVSIGIHQILDMYIGESEKKLHQLFEMARQNAPTILFFDEVDALAADRVDLRKSAGRTLINQFLAEMDGDIGNNEGLLILGATNAPWHIDPAFRRPGRFDRVLFVPPPDGPAREAIIQVLAKDKPVDRLDPRKLAKVTKDFSGADLKAVFDTATEASLTLAMKENRIVPLTTDQLVRAAKRVKPSTRAWFESAKNYALYANQGGFYNDVLKFLGISK
ncbi:MAG: AAA family ATPase [Verrucomicrobiota bacterium]